MGGELNEKLCEQGSKLIIGIWFKKLISLLYTHSVESFLKLPHLSYNLGAK